MARPGAARPGAHPGPRDGDSGRRSSRRRIALGESGRSRERQHEGGADRGEDCDAHGHVQTLFPGDDGAKPSGPLIRSSSGPAPHNAQGPASWLTCGSRRRREFSDSFRVARFAPCHQRSDCERTIRLGSFGRLRAEAYLEGSNIIPVPPDPPDIDELCTSTRDMGHFTLGHPCSCRFLPPRDSNRSSSVSAGMGASLRLRSPKPSPPRRTQSAAIFAISPGVAFAAASMAARFRCRRLRARLKSVPARRSIARRRWVGR